MFNVIACNRLGDNEVVGPSILKKPSRQRSRNTNKITAQTKDNEETVLTKSETSRRPQTNQRRISTTTERYESVQKSRTTTPLPPTTPDPGAGTL